MPLSRIYASGLARQEIKGTVKTVIILRPGNRMSRNAFSSGDISLSSNSGKSPSIFTRDGKDGVFCVRNRLATMGHGKDGGK